MATRGLDVVHYRGEYYVRHVPSGMFVHGSGYPTEALAEGFSVVIAKLADWWAPSQYLQKQCDLGRLVLDKKEEFDELRTILERVSGGSDEDDHEDNAAHVAA